MCERCFRRELAAQMNGYDGDGTTPDMVAIGVGALGSQVLTNLVRSGYGRWTLVDEDVLHPHNLGTACTWSGICRTLQIGSAFHLLGFGHWRGGRIQGQS